MTESNRVATINDENRVLVVWRDNSNTEFKVYHGMVGYYDSAKNVNEFQTDMFDDVLYDVKIEIWQGSNTPHDEIKIAEFARRDFRNVEKAYKGMLKTKTRYEKLNEREGVTHTIGAMLNKFARAMNCKRILFRDGLAMRVYDLGYAVSVINNHASAE